MSESRIITDPRLREQTGVYADRADAGARLAGLLRPLALRWPLVLAIPAGGVPVAVPLAQQLAAALDVAVVSKVTLPWNSEAGYGAVAFDGTTRLNHELVRQTGLSDRDVERGVTATREKVARRVALFRDKRPFPELAGRSVILVDDGLASGFTLRTAVAAVRRAGAASLLVAVPTGHAAAVRLLAGEVEILCCGNLRGGRSFAVASAYRSWRDVAEEEALAMLVAYHRSVSGPDSGHA